MLLQRVLSITPVQDFGTAPNPDRLRIAQGSIKVRELLSEGAGMFGDLQTSRTGFAPPLQAQQGVCCRRENGQATKFPQASIHTQWQGMSFHGALRLHPKPPECG